MKISVVIPSFNRLHTLARAIDSVLNQTSAVDQIIVVDDGSTDGSGDFIVKNYPQINLIRQPNSGVSAARNAGIRQAKYEWVAFLDSDDSWFPQKISCVRTVQCRHYDYLFFHSDEIWIRNGVRVNAMKKHKKAGGWIFEQCLPLCVISPSAAIIRKSLLESVGLFDESLVACEDYDLWLKVCHQHPVYFLEQALITKFGGHKDQLSRSHWGMDRFRIQALNRLLLNATLSEENYQSTIVMLVTKLKILLKGAEKHNNLEVIHEFTPVLKNWLPQIEKLVPC